VAAVSWSHGHELTDEQSEIRALVARFADEVVAPRAAEWDREHRFPKEVFTQLGELGLMGVCVPEDVGGAGADFLSYVLVLEELSRGDAGAGVTLAVHTGAGTLPILAHGTREQVERLVPPLAQGHEIAAFALTEPGSGSDAGAMVTRADEEHRLTGTKQWVTNGSHAHVFTVFAKQDGAVSAFVARRGAEGFRWALVNGTRPDTVAYDPRNPSTAAPLLRRDEMDAAVVDGRADSLWRPTLERAGLRPRAVAGAFLYRWR